MNNERASLGIHDAHAHRTFRFDVPSLPAGLMSLWHGHNSLFLVDCTNKLLNYFWSICMSEYIKPLYCKQMSGYEYAPSVWEDRFRVCTIRFIFCQFKAKCTLTFSFDLNLWLYGFIKGPPFYRVDGDTFDFSSPILRHRITARGCHTPCSCPSGTGLKMAQSLGKLKT